MSRKLIRISYCTAFAFVFSCSSLTVQPSNAFQIAASSAESEIAIEILEQTWSNKQDARASADKLVATQKAAGPLDVNSAYAYLLAKIRQSDIRKAIPAAQQVLEIDPNHVGANHALTWLLLLARKQNAALTALKSFDEANDNSKAISAEDRLRNVGSIGRMYGYLEGPMKSEVTDAEMRLVLDAIQKDASDTKRSTFEAERTAVLAKYEEIITDKEVTQSELLETARREQKEQLSELKEQEEALEDRENELQPIREQVSEEGLAAINSIRQKASPIEAEMSRVNQEAYAVRIDISNLLAQAAQLDALAEAQEDPALHDEYHRQADLYRISASRADFVLAGLQRQLRSLSGSLEAVRRELISAQRFYGAKIDSVDAALEDVDKEQKRTQGMKKRARRPARASSGRTKALENRAKGIKTYEDFPVELERERLLVQLKSRG